MICKNQSWSRHFASHNIEGTILEYVSDTPIRIVRSLCKTDVIVITEVVINESHYDDRSHYYPTENFNLTTKTKACFASHLHLDLVSVLVHYISPIHKLSIDNLQKETTKKKERNLELKKQSKIQRQRVNLFFRKAVTHCCCSFVSILFFSD